MLIDRTIRDQETLEFGSLWTLSGFTGRSRAFDANELAAFWRSVDEVASRSSMEAAAVLRGMSTHRVQLLAAFEVDGRSVVSGLRDVVTILDRLDEGTAVEIKRALLTVGRSVAVARGPFGQSMSSEDGQSLLLLAQLLEYQPDRDRTGILIGQ